MRKEVEDLLEALRAVVDRREPARIAAARAAIEACRAAIGDVKPRSAGCRKCGHIANSGYALSTAREPDSLAAGSYAIVPVDLRSKDRCWEELRCPACGMCYVYRRDYEYLAGGSEDEEELTRLHVPDLLAAAKVQLDWEERGWSSELDRKLRLLESAFRLDPPT